MSRTTLYSTVSRTSTVRKRLDFRKYNNVNGDSVRRCRMCGVASVQVLRISRRRSGKRAKVIGVPRSETINRKQKPELFSFLFS